MPAGLDALTAEQTAALLPALQVRRLGGGGGGRLAAPLRHQLETVVLLQLRHGPQRDVLQNQHALGRPVIEVLEVVQTVVFEDAPAALPGLDAAAPFAEPAAVFWLAQCPSQFGGSVVCRLRQLLGVQLVVQLQQLVPRQRRLSGVRHHLHKVLGSRLIRNTRVMERRVEDDEGEDECLAVVRLEARVRVLAVVLAGEALEHAVHLLVLSVQQEGVQEAAQGSQRRQLAEVEQPQEGGQHGPGKLARPGQVGSDGPLLQVVPPAQEAGHGRRGVGQQALLDHGVHGRRRGGVEAAAGD